MPLTCTPGGGAAAVAAWAAVAVPTDSSSAAAASMIRLIGPSPGSRGQHQPSKGRKQVRDGVTPLSGADMRRSRPCFAGDGHERTTWNSYRVVSHAGYESSRRSRDPGSVPGNTDARDSARPDSIG